MESKRVKIIVSDPWGFVNVNGSEFCARVKSSHKITNNDILSVYLILEFCNEVFYNGLVRKYFKASPHYADISIEMLVDMKGWRKRGLALNLTSMENASANLDFGITPQASLNEMRLIADLMLI